MVNIFKALTGIFLLLFSLNNFGQSSQLKVEVLVPFENSAGCYKIFITNTSGSILEDTFESDYDTIIDKLKPGEYKIQVQSCNSNVQHALTRSFNLLPNKKTNLSIDLNFTELVLDLDTLSRTGIERNKMDVQLSLSYFNTNWLNTPSFVKSNFAIGFSSYNWSAFSRHLGFLVGMGSELSHHIFSIDTTFINAPQFKKIYESYTYLNFHLDLKFRLSGGNQQKDDPGSSKLFMDVGAIYNAPLIFKHAVRYSDNKKIANGRLHQFTDLRANINFGYSHAALFFEYRLLDFIIGSYPELPLYNVGLRVSMN